MTKAIRLDKRSVAGLVPGAARYTIWDADDSGFGVRVEPSGRKSFLVRYLAEGGGRGAPQRQATLGRFPAMSVTEAREAARDVRADVRKGGDPVAAKAAQRREMTVAGLVDLYESEGLVVQRGIRIGEPMKPLTAQYTMARLRHHVVPLLGSRRVSEIHEGDIEAFARAVAAGKTAKDEKTGPRTRVIVKGGDGAARKVVRDLSAVFAFAQRRRLLTANPVASASVRKTDNRRERYLSIPEIQRLGAALDELEAEGVNRKAVDIARLWALTGCRRNEVAGLRWDEVDRERGLLMLEDSKTGRSVRPLSAAALALIEAVRAKSIDDGERHEADGHPHDSPYVFPAERGDGHYQGTKKVWPEAIKRAELPGVSPHTLRHSLGSAAASAGEALLQIGALLGHSNARSTQIYAHVAHDPARLAADRATAGIAAAMGRAVPAPQPADSGD
jgi:integrase